MKKTWIALLLWLVLATPLAAQSGMDAGYTMAITQTRDIL